MRALRCAALANNLPPDAPPEDILLLAKDKDGAHLVFDKAAQAHRKAEHYNRTYKKHGDY